MEPQANTLGTTATAPTFTTTMPSTIRRHNISDEELEMLRTANRDGLSEAFWAFVGAAIGGVPSAATALADAYINSPREPLSVLSLVGVVMTLGCIALAITIKIIDAKKGTRARNLIEEIRERPAR